MSKGTWRDRDQWASASVIPPLLMIGSGVLIWPIGIFNIVVGAYLIWIIGKAQKEQVNAINRS